MGENVTRDYQRHKLLFYRVFERFFGAKGRKLDEKVLDGYWHVLGNYQLDILSKALDNIAVKDDQYLPDAGAIIAEMGLIRSSDTKTIVPVYCPACSCAGIVLVTKVYNGTAYASAYRCDCANGSRVDRRIGSISSIGGIHIAPEDAIEKRLPITSLEELRSHLKGHVWEDGVEVSMMCADCHKPYSVRHERRVSAAELQTTYLKRTRPYQCEPCFIEEGRRRGAWT